MKEVLWNPFKATKTRGSLKNDMFMTPTWFVVGASRPVLTGRTACHGALLRLVQRPPANTAEHAVQYVIFTTVGMIAKPLLRMNRITNNNLPSTVK